MIEVNVTETANAVTLVEVNGRVDSMNANQFRAGLIDQINNGNVQLVLDLSNVDYMSSAGLREIIATLKKAKKEKGDLRLVQPSKRVLDVLEMAGLQTIFRIYATQDEAIRSY